MPSRFPSNLLLLVLFFSSSLSLVSSAATGEKAQEKPCTIHQDGKFYDLTPLQASKDYEFKTQGGHQVVLNVCRSVRHETWGLDVEDPGEVGAFIRKDHGDFSMGKVNRTLAIKPPTSSSPNPSIQLTYASGSLCKSSDSMHAQTTIEFICDTSVFSAGTPNLVAQFPPEDDLACGFYVEWRTHVACPTGERGVAGVFSMFLMTALILTMLYLVIGILHNRFVLHLQGYDQIPQFSLSSMRYHVSHFVEWLKEVWQTGRFELPGGGSLGGGGGLGGFGGRREDVNPVSHQAGVRPTPTPAPGPNAHAQPSAAAPGFGSKTNPFSHQAQAHAQSQGSSGFVRPTPSTASKPTPPLPSTAFSDNPPEQTAKSLSSPPEERKTPNSGRVGAGVFSVEDEADDEDGGQELVDVPSSTSTSTPTPAAPPHAAPATAVPQGSSADVAGVRGRGVGMDSEGVIRL
ncbi:hypothetical protein ONZ45_g9948 [Pleurotus djamor]|nr:hypothetical protein ONZ45_g9948 [Pleurotus djamor]